jgi:hypothetical protein
MKSRSVFVVTCIVRTDCTFTGKYWLEDGTVKNETCSHSMVLMTVCYCCVSTEWSHFILGIKNTMYVFY